MPHVLCLLLFVLSCANSVTCSLIFATTGKDVTLRCQCSKNRNCHEEVIRWVRMDSNESLQIIDNKCEQSPCRFASKTLNGTQVVLLTIAQVEPGDSGRYYCVEHYRERNKRDMQFNDNGTLLMVGDPKSLPVMRVFLNRTAAVVCELKGGDPTWSDPQWEIDDAKDGLTLQAETFIDAQGAFIRSSILSLKDGIRALNCVCRHITGVIIRTRVMQDSKDQCQLLLYLSPLAVVLLLVTVTASGLWAWRRRKQSPIAQGMDSTYGI